MLWIGIFLLTVCIIMQVLIVHDFKNKTKQALRNGYTPEEHYASAGFENSVRALTFVYIIGGISIAIIVTSLIVRWIDG